jgi:hypothetical protein
MGCRRPSTTQAEGRTDVRAELETVYAKYLQAIRSEDAEMLCSVLPAARVRDLKRVFELNGMVFPRDYFTMFKRHAPVLPPLDGFRHVAVTRSDPYANLIYVGEMNGYLRAIPSSQRFLIIQFEREQDGWKYAVITDLPVEIVPDWKRKLADGQLDFLQSRPFKAERIELKP